MSKPPIPLLGWFAIAQIVMLVAVLAFSLTSWAAVRQQRAQVSKLEQRLEQQVARLDRFASAPPSLDDLRLGEVAGAFVKYRRVLELGDQDGLDRTRWPADAKTITVRTEHRIPGEPTLFDPWLWSAEVHGLCAQIDDREADGGVAARIDEVVAKPEPFRVDHGDATFYVHPFSFRLGERTIGSGWVGASGQSAMLVAFLHLHRATGNAAFLERARRVFRSFARPRDPATPDAPWVAFVDRSQYLWFEAFPMPDGPQPRSLSGHIHALEALYAFHRVEPSETSRLLLLAGMTTVQRYFRDFRRPGQTNRFCLSPPDLADPDPKRSIVQQKWLYDVTGDRLFKNSWMAFLTDMPF